MDNKYGTITEQGDLGLGFNVLSESDQDILKNNKKDENSERKENNEHY